MKYYELLWNIVKVGWWDRIWNLLQHFTEQFCCSLSQDIEKVFNCLSSSLAPAIDLNVCQEQRMWMFQNLSPSSFRSSHQANGHSLVPTISFIRRSRYGITMYNSHEYQVLAHTCTLCSLLNKFVVKLTEAQYSRIPACAESLSKELNGLTSQCDKFQSSHFWNSPPPPIFYLPRWVCLKMLG